MIRSSGSRSLQPGERRIHGLAELADLGPGPHLDASVTARLRCHCPAASAAEK